MPGKQKLELTWIGKENRLKLELRILLEDPAKAVLAKCEWGHDDYSLKIESLPKAPPPQGQQQLF